MREMGEWSYNPKTYRLSVIVTVAAVAAVLLSSVVFADFSANSNGVTFSVSNEAAGSRSTFGEDGALHTDRSTIRINDSTIVGDRNTIHGDNNTIIGSRNTIRGDNNVIIGSRNTARGTNNAAEGSRNTIN